jgi:hypothetical protein
MTQYLISVYQPDGPEPAPDDLAKISADLDAVRQELSAVGGWVFSAGLHPPGSATVLRPAGAEMIMTDGPFAEGKEHLGGFTVIDVPDLDAALGWGRKFARATTLPIEVRPLRAGPRD